MSKASERKLLIVVGLGILCLAGIIFLNRSAPPANDASQPQLGGNTNTGSVQTTDLPQQDTVTPSDSATTRPNLKDPPVSADGVSVPDDEAPREEREIYTMETLPQGKSGIYWVRDSDGNVLQIAVDVPGTNSPVGL